MADTHEQGHHHDDHGEDEHEHGLVEVTLLLEDEHLEALDETAEEISRDLNQD